MRGLKKFWRNKNKTSSYGTRLQTPKSLHPFSLATYQETPVQTHTEDIHRAAVVQDNLDQGTQELVVQVRISWLEE